ncbi:uncharacterized protein TM35_000051150 [Trypanosoma theileri]|uniref:Uncharacterized protein n=1 Tax=Trypanosoma theileri TaxID=67003 RepID=A0A1X0P4P1_9TRYP|nr:uncharacterized protein TM35_000051150 [Trypanosoma theileri]ORC91519.1 hypothetical protein TM35_000051150 [Trypanosoma theileri]
MKGMSHFTREDERNLEILRSKKELGHLQLDETQLLQQLEQRYDEFIKEGLRNLVHMAPRKGITQFQLKYVLVSWPMLCLVLCFVFVSIFLLYSQEGSGRWVHSILKWNIELIGLLLAAATLVGFTRMRERPFINRTVLISCALTTAVLSVVSFVLLLKTRNTEEYQWDGRVGLILGAMNTVIMVISILLLFSNF